MGGIEPSIESPNGEELHLLLTEWRWFAANTFWPLGQGTWQSTRGSQCRSDNVCLPLQWENDVVSCSIETDLAVQTTVSVGGSSAPESVVSRRVPFCDRSEL